MNTKRHRIQFPKQEAHDLAQDEVYFYVVEPDGMKTKLRFHDYSRIYDIPGMYEPLKISPNSGYWIWEPVTA